MILFIIYALAGYWAAGQTVFKNKIIIQSVGSAPIFFQKLLWGLFLGWALIPIAIIRSVFGI